jgi:hypothetical protein
VAPASGAWKFFQAEAASRIALIQALGAQMRIRWKFVAGISLSVFALALGALVFSRNLQPAYVSPTRVDPGYRFSGVATLKEDGQICLQMRTEEPDMPVAEGYFCKKPSDPGYADIREHVGPISIGKEKEFDPFPK